MTKLSPRDLLSLHRQLLARRHPGHRRLLEPASPNERRAVDLLVRRRGILTVFALLLWVMTHAGRVVTSLTTLSRRFDELAEQRARELAEGQVAA